MGEHQCRRGGVVHDHVSLQLDRATAKAVDLIATDLPRWKQTPIPSSSWDQAMTGRLATCAGAKDPSLLNVVDVQSPHDDQGQTEVSSDVTMVKTYADGIADLEALQAPNSIRVCSRSRSPS